MWVLVDSPGWLSLLVPVVPVGVVLVVPVCPFPSSPLVVEDDVVSAASRYGGSPTLAVRAAPIGVARASYCSRLTSGVAVTPSKWALSVSGDFGSSARTPVIAPVMTPIAPASASTRRGVVERTCMTLSRTARPRPTARCAFDARAWRDREPRRTRFRCDVMPAPPPVERPATNSESHQGIRKVRKRRSLDISVRRPHALAHRRSRRHRPLDPERRRRGSRRALRAPRRRPSGSAVRRRRA